MQNWVKRVMSGSRDPHLNFWDPPISRERLKLETSNLARGGTAVSSNEKNEKLGQKGSCGGHATHFWNFGTPLISRERLKLETSNLARRGTAVSSNEKNAQLGQKGSCGGQARVNDVSCVVIHASNLFFANFRYPGPKMPKIT